MYPPTSHIVYISILDLILTLYTMIFKTSHPLFYQRKVFQVAKDMNILITMESGSNFEMSGLLERVHQDSVRLEKKVKKKMMAEGEFYKEKHGLKDYDTTNK